MMQADINTVVRQLSDVRPPVETSCSLPGACYSDPGILELEKQAIFAGNWIGIGRADQLKNPGDFSTLDIVGIPVILLRDTRGRLRAYANTCRHRGARLLSGSGNCQMIRCPFHRWTYALDGRLLTAPKFNRSDQFDYGEYGLIELSLAERFGFVFLSLNDDVKSIDDHLLDFGGLHAPWSFDQLVSYRRHVFEVNCNWKAFLDVFNEYYHLPYVHRDSINSLYLSPQPGDPVGGDFATQFGATEGTGALLESTQQYSLPPIESLDQTSAQGARYSWVFPNMTFAAGTESVWIYEAYPITPQRSQIVLTLCFPESTTGLDEFEASARFYFDRLLTAIDEDIEALENQQLGLNSPFARQGRFHPELESNVASFAIWYARQLSRFHPH